MGSLPYKGSTESRLRAGPAVFRRIDDPKVDRHDCRQAVLHLGARIAAGEPREALLPMADAWLDEDSTLAFRALIDSYGRDL